MFAPLVLGGIPVPLDAGAPECTYEPAGGYTDATLTDGSMVRMRRWDKTLITLSGTGWMTTGLDALDWDSYHTLLCPTPRRINSAGGPVMLTSDPRPDVPVTAHALVAGNWVPTPVTLDGREATPDAVVGATLYTVEWYPQFLVLCTPPPESAQAGQLTWSIICREA